MTPTNGRGFGRGWATAFVQAFAPRLMLVPGLRGTPMPVDVRLRYWPPHRPVGTRAISRRRLNHESALRRDLVGAKGLRP